MCRCLCRWGSCVHTVQILLIFSCNFLIGYLVNPWLCSLMATSTNDCLRCFVVCQGGKSLWLNVLLIFTSSAWRGWKGLSSPAISSSSPQQHLKPQQVNHPDKQKLGWDLGWSEYFLDLQSFHLSNTHVRCSFFSRFKAFIVICI